MKKEKDLTQGKQPEPPEISAAQMGQFVREHHLKLRFGAVSQNVRWEDDGWPENAHEQR